MRRHAPTHPVLLAVLIAVLSLLVLPAISATTAATAPQATAAPGAGTVGPQAGGPQTASAVRPTPQPAAVHDDAAAHRASTSLAHPLPPVTDPAGESLQLPPPGTSEDVVAAAADPGDHATPAQGRAPPAATG